MRRFEQDRKAALAGKYNYLNPKKSFTVPSEYIKQVLMRGTGFIGGKGRVYKIFETEIDAGTRAKRIKAEYGQGGAGWPVKHRVSGSLFTPLPVLFTFPSQYYALSVTRSI